MTDKTQDASEFSFRTFDIYRRFVEVLQCEPNYLDEFKTGSPSKETCLAVIKSVFQSQQQDEEIKMYTQYFAIHAKMMASHAEKLPDDWNDAVDYTDRYIKEIRKYLRRKGISVRSNLNKVEEIANDIGKYIHDKPTVKQIKAIRYYLKYDLRNPKRNLISPHTPTNPKSKSDSRVIKNFIKLKSQIINDKVVEEQKVAFVQKENDQSSSAYESMQGTPHFLQINDEESYNNNEVMDPPLQFENIETEIIDDLFEMVDSNIPKYKMDMNGSDILNYKGNVMSPELSPFNSYVGIENSSEVERIEGSEGVGQTFKTDIVNCSPTKFNTENEDRSSSYNVQLKRKSSSPYESDHYYSLKKQLQFCRRIPNNIPQKPIMTSSQATGVISSSDNSSDSEINVENDNEGEQLNRFFLINQYEESNESEGKTSFDSEISEQMKNSIFNLESKARDMSYADAVKHIDLATTFCELKNAISQKELHIMQQIRDKIYFKSLNE